MSQPARRIVRLLRSSAALRCVSSGPLSANFLAKNPRILVQKVDADKRLGRNELAKLHRTEMAFAGAPSRFIRAASRGVGVSGATLRGVVAPALD